MFTRSTAALALGTTSFTLVALQACSEPMPVMRHGLQGATTSTKPFDADRDAAAVTVRSLKLATFNLGLTPTVPGRVERTPRIEQALAKLDADVLCLQEAWSPETQERIESVLAQSKKSVVQGPTATASLPGRCTGVETNKIERCLSRSCRGASDPVECAYGQCRTLMAELSPSCTMCLADDPDQAPADALSTCRAGRAANASAFGGSTGLMLALSTPPREHSGLLLPSQRVARGVITARLAAPDVDVYCTHLSARSEYASNSEWRKVAERQVAELRRELNARSAQRPAIVLGDLNFTLADQNLFEPLQQAGFISAYATRDGRCTLCNAANSGPVIDHILTRQPLTVVSVQRVFDIGPTLSDHFGVTATVELIDPRPTDNVPVLWRDRGEASHLWL